MVTLREVKDEELERGLKLALDEGWAAGPASFSTPVALDRGLCLAAAAAVSSSSSSSQLAGTAFAVAYDSEGAFVLNVLVDPAFRRRGVARKMVSALLERLRSAGVAIVGLDASNAGRHLYETLGFRESFSVPMFSWDASSFSAAAAAEEKKEEVVPLAEDMIEEVAQLDAHCFGFYRARMLRQYLCCAGEEAPCGFVVRGRGAVAARKVNPETRVIGPLIADSDTTAKLLLGALMRKLLAEGVKHAVAFVPAWHSESASLLQSHGFSRDCSSCTRMWLRLSGEDDVPISRRETAGYYIIFGPDLG